MPLGDGHTDVRFAGIASRSPYFADINQADSKVHATAFLQSNTRAETNYDGTLNFSDLTACSDLISSDCP